MDDLFTLKQRIAAVHLAEAKHVTALKRRIEGLKGNPSLMAAGARQHLVADLGMAEAKERLLIEALELAGRLQRAEAVGNG